MDKSFWLLTALYFIFAFPLSLMNSKKFRISIPLLFFGSLLIVFFRFGFLPVSTVETVKNLILAVLTSFLVYFCIRVLTADYLSFPDILFGVFSSLYTGFYMNLVSVFFAALLGMLYYLFLSLAQKVRKKKIIFRPIFAISFVPFITLGSLLSMILFYVIA